MFLCPTTYTCVAQRRGVVKQKSPPVYISSFLLPPSSSVSHVDRQLCALQALSVVFNACIYDVTEFDRVLLFVCILYSIVLEDSPPRARVCVYACYIIIVDNRARRTPVRKHDARALPSHKTRTRIIYSVCVRARGRETITSRDRYLKTRQPTPTVITLTVRVSFASLCESPSHADCRPTNKRTDRE